MDACLVIAGGAARNGGRRTPALVWESFRTLLGGQSRRDPGGGLCGGMLRCLGMQHHVVALWGRGLDHRLRSSCLAVLARIQFEGRHAWLAYVLIGLFAVG